QGLRTLRSTAGSATPGPRAELSRDSRPPRFAKAQSPGDRTVALDLAVDLRHLFGNPLVGKGLDAIPGCAPQLHRTIAVAEDLDDALGEGLAVPVLGQNAGVAYQVTNTADVGRDDRDATRHRFEDRVIGRSVIEREDADACSSVRLTQLFVAD